MNIRTPAACCHKHRSNNEVKWKTLMNTSTLPRSPTSLYIPVAGSKYTTVWWNKHSRTHTHKHTVRESPESWDWIKSFSSSFHGFLPTEREEGRHSQSQRSEEWPSLTDCPGDWNTNQPFPAIGLGSAPAALLGRLAEAVAKKIKKLLITTARITGQAWKSLWTCCRSATIVSVLLQDKVLRQAK